jgi:tetratricopeptide (TPR) repeat protein
MQVVVPYQNKEWQQLKKIAGLWIIEQPQLADAWYFLGTAEFESHQIVEAKQHLNKCMALNSRHLDAMLTLSRIALLEKSTTDLEKIIRLIKPLDEAEAEKLSMKVLALKSE